MQAQGPFALVLKAPLSSLDATYKKVQMAPFPPHCVNANVTRLGRNSPSQTLTNSILITD
jgi:hypothetical protein